MIVGPPMSEGKPIDSYTCPICKEPIDTLDRHGMGHEKHKREVILLNALNEIKHICSEILYTDNAFAIYSIAKQAIENAEVSND